MKHSKLQKERVEAVSLHQINRIVVKLNAVKLKEWRQLINKNGQSNILQAWPYALAYMATERLQPRFATFHKGNKIIALCQIFEKKLLGFYHIVSLHRGPLFTDRDPDPEDIKTVYQLLRKSYPRKFWRRCHFLFELEHNARNRLLLHDCGFVENRREKYHSAWLSLSPNLEAIRKNFHGKWRNALNKAEKQNLILDLDRQGEHLSWLMLQNKLDQQVKNFRGPSLAMVAHLCKHAKKNEEFFLFRALKDHHVIGAIIIFRHGKAATYLVGWTSEEGRNSACHNALLWESIIRLKEEGVEWLDLGGMNEESAKGVTNFKRGLNGQEYHLIGAWR